MARAHRRCREVVPMPKAGAKWKQLRLTVKGTAIHRRAHGVKTVDVQDSKFGNGHVPAIRPRVVKFPQKWKSKRCK